MNEIEQRFYSEFQEYARLSPSFTVMDMDCGAKIADCKVMAKPRSDNNEAGAEVAVECSFPRLGKGYEQTLFSYLLEPQEEIGPYKVDFGLMMQCQITFECPRLAIEIDGHEWHEKNKEQAASDKRRDRELLARDVSVMRFTGSEVYRNPRACVEEVFKASISLAFERSLVLISNTRSFRDIICAAGEVDAMV